MARATEKRAATVEEAVEAALHELGAPSRRLGSTSSRNPEGGVLGVGAQEAIVRVRATRRRTIE